MAEATEPFDSQAVDLTNCDREPIHILGRVQTFGCLLALSPDWMVMHASLNVDGFLGRDAADLIGRPVTDVLSPEALHRIRSTMQTSVGNDAVQRVFGIPVLEGRPDLFDVAVHFSENAIVIEFERNNYDAHNQYTSQVRTMVERLRKCSTPDSLCDTAARFVKALTGFDRVMVYRFATDGSGEVVAESAKPDIGSFLGLHYPASDIPKQARELYRRNLLRIISDVDDDVSPIIPPTNPEGRPLDLSMSGLRAVSPIHIEYLRNMGVKASMSISILRRGTLWGLFSCHHYAPLVLSYEVRTACELFGEMFGFVLDQLLGDLASKQTATSQTLHNKLMAQLADGSSVRDSFVPLADALTSLIPCAGVAGWIDGSYLKRGQVPTQDEFMQIARFLNTAATGKVYSTDRLPSVFPAAAAFTSEPAGLLALPVSRAPRDYIVLFRKEIAQTIRWAGDPSKPVEYGPNGARLTPRKSFEAWQETVRGRSRPWEDGELNAAEALRVTMLEVVLRIVDVASQDRDRARQQQEILIAELNHRVRNILNLIRGLVSQSSQGASSAEEFINVVGGRIQALARAHDQITEEKWAPASVKEMILAETEAYLRGKAKRVIISGPTPFVEPSAITSLSLVIHEMVTNSAKYGALSNERGKVEIQMEAEPDGGLSIAWREKDGPPVTAPTRRGFGSTIIQRSIPFELQGKADLRYVETGLEADFFIPALHVDRFDVTDESGPAPATAPSGETSLISGDVLLVEDNMLIALETEQYLMDIGASRVHVSSTVNSALKHLET